ncbi:uncharacterized protein LOC127978691 isoform X4 [Carassius gibelio]|uniref:uncharacterized protein LOC127978691 isoform X4 n=1 Tax=Carassius gibelio TaxID=101364 RepID=UPI0022784DB2|nr:uncharacterized protein LOC127978691 isoform X4 [Carassius gibelio]
MEKIMLFCVFSFLIVQISCSEHNVTLLRFRQNESITLNCSIKEQFTYRFRMAWYHQNPESVRLTLLLSANYKSILSYQRHRIFAKIGDNLSSLVISRLNEADSGLYFCGTPKDSDMQFMQFMHFNKPIRLVMEDGLTDIEEKEDDEITASTVEVMLTERVMVFGGVGLAVFQFFLVTVVAGGIIHCYGWQKGWAAAKRAGVTD